MVRSAANRQGSQGNIRKFHSVWTVVILFLVLGTMVLAVDDISRSALRYSTQCSLTPYSFCRPTVECDVWLICGELFTAERNAVYDERIKLE